MEGKLELMDLTVSSLLACLDIGEYEQGFGSS